MSDPTLESPLTDVDSTPAWRPLVRNFATLLVGEGSARVLGLIAILVLARELGPGGFGLAMVGIALVGLFSLVADSGTEILTLRNVSREPGRFREIAERILGLRLTLSLVGTAAYLIVVSLLASSPSNRSVYLGFAIALPAVALNLRWVVLGVGAAKAVALANVAAQVVFLSGIVALVHTEHDVFLVPYAYAAGELAYAAVVLAAVVPRFGLLRPRIDLRFWHSTLRESLPLIGGSAARGILFAFDLFLIGLVLGPPFAGYYSAGSKPVQFVGMAVGLFYVSFVSSYSAAGPLARAVFRRSARAALAVAVPIAAAASVGAATVVPIVFGDDYSRAAPVLAILAWRIPFQALVSPYNGLLIGDGRTLLVMRSYIAAAIVTVAGSLVAIPIFGIEGAAVVSVASSATVFAFSYRSAVSRELAPALRALLARA
jgi:O-antigen/teichoic acid export membrane protein